ncbi:GMC family oxidoreductase [Streptomyces sp. SID6673]|nr:GMC family oxidoreductase [Streptomyces sp. SID11726]NEB22820.1 GMC family oxidoreductase [Streptomyces sp. SID6673]
MTVTRRSFLTGAAVAGAASLLPATATAAPGAGRGVRLTRENHRAIVVGSGFGGGVTALRLTEAGVPVLMLERGKRWRTGPNAETFPHATAPDKRFLWHKSTGQILGRKFDFEPYLGLVDAVVGENMTALAPAGLGGGSLVYQGMTLQPAEHVFNEYLPEQLDWQTLNRVYYPRVARMLQIETAPDALIRSENYRAARVFARNARRAGLPVSKIPMPIDWNYALAEIHGKMKPSYTNGDGAMGVNNGGKHSVDVTYIKAAEATGLLTIATMHEVTDVARAANGHWQVHVDRTDLTGKVLERKILTTPTLVMAAGSVHTTRLLVRAAANGGIPDLPDAVGRGWGTNADRIYVWNSLTDGFGAQQGGPVVYGSLNWKNASTAHTVIQASIPPMPIDAHSTMMVGYGVSRDRGHFAFDSGRGDAFLKWPKNGDATIHLKSIEPTAKRIAGPTGRLIDTNAVVNTTWHSLGGACMGSVCDLDGRVHGQRGLYVIDGALLPGTTAACNPSMTIAALAERALDNIVAKDVGTTI